MVNNIYEKLLIWLGFQVVLNIESNFEDLRIVQRKNKQFLQRLVEANWAQERHWEDIKEINYER